MKSLSPFAVVACLSWTVVATPNVENGVMRREAVGPGCTDCPTGSWTIDPTCTGLGEYAVVGRSIMSPPASVKFDGSAFCSAFLRPIVSKVDTVTVTGPSTDTEYWQTTITNPHTSSPATVTKANALPTKRAMPAITAAPVAERAALEKRDYTVPDYLTDWWYYGRLYPGCSCVITSAQPYSFTSYTETASVYNVTVTETVTGTYIVS